MTPNDQTDDDCIKNKLFVQNFFHLSIIDDLVTGGRRRLRSCSGAGRTVGRSGWSWWPWPPASPASASTRPLLLQNSIINDLVSGGRRRWISCSGAGWTFGRSGWSWWPGPPASPRPLLVQNSIIDDLVSGGRRRLRSCSGAGGTVGMSSWSWWPWPPTGTPSASTCPLLVQNSMIDDLFTGGWRRLRSCSG
jgi:hypothetical protein